MNMLGRVAREICRQWRRIQRIFTPAPPDHEDRAFLRQMEEVDRLLQPVDSAAFAGQFEEIDRLRERQRSSSSEESDASANQFEEVERVVARLNVAWYSIEVTREDAESSISSSFHLITTTYNNSNSR